MKNKNIKCKNYTDVVETIAQGRYHKSIDELFEIERKTINTIMCGKITNREQLERIMGDW